MTTSKIAHTQPFLRWTGSKRWFVKEHVSRFLPKIFNNYHEPFLGGGAMFFFIKQEFPSNRNYFLSDSNNELINTYTQLRDCPDKVINCLKRFKNTKENYYKIRDSQPANLVQKAARFIYLNRTSFNGIYRVNSVGNYNVPYGNRKNVDFVTENLLESVSALLYDVSLTTCSFEHSLRNVTEGDLVFLDPPYTVAHENNGFIEYNQKLFSWEDQEKLRNMIDSIIRKNAFFILTNASHGSIETLYENVGQIATLSRPSIVGGRNKTRGVYNELIIHNF